MKIFIGGALPYANESLHIGHLAGLLPGDIIARYFRQKGDEVLYVSGSDCHGTPITIRANQEGVDPKVITDKYHNEFKECFKKLGFSYDIYNRTDDQLHKKTVQEIFVKLKEKGYIFSKTVEQTFCEKCNQFLPDRYIEGRCPNCGQSARGDQCENCCTVLTPEDLKDKKCKICGSVVSSRETEHLYFEFSKFQDKIQEFLNNSIGWRENAVNLTQRYLNEGIKDRAVTRDLSWGIDVPVEGYEGKKLYIWIENVWGYLSASIEWSLKNNRSWEDFWKGDDITAYYVHGKDNIPFHTVIFPSLLLAVGDLHLPDRIISSEFLNLEGSKLSKSRNWAVWLPYIIEKYNPDSIRYFFTINAPEKRDCDFSWREFINSHNGELLGAFGNFVNRNLAFINKTFEGKVPASDIDLQIKNKLQKLYSSVGLKIEAGELKSALEEIFDFIRSSNKYFDEQRPWIQVKEDASAGAKTLYTCVQIIANLANLLNPFLPFACEKIRNFLSIPKEKWEYIEIKECTKINNLQILFEQIDKSVIQEEVEKLGLKD